MRSKEIMPFSMPLNNLYWGRFVYFCVRLALDFYSRLLELSSSVRRCSLLSGREDRLLISGSQVRALLGSQFKCNDLRGHVAARFSCLPLAVPLNNSNKFSVIANSISQL